MGRCDGKLKILAWCAERPEKPRCFGRFAGFGRRVERIFGSYRRGLPAEGNPALHHPSDPQFHPVRLVQGRQSVNGCAKTIYKAPEEAGLEALDDLERIWSAKYPAGIKSWRDHWDELATMYKYPEPIRRVIYTTNAIENFNRQLRKVTKTKSAFVSDDALLKQLYLITMQVTESWTMPIKVWGQILVHLMIFLGDRVSVTL